jgi:RNA polymerase sigma-70 factor (ECF subfamily)
MSDDRLRAVVDQLDWMQRWFLANTVDATVADDLVQSTYLEAIRNIHKLQSAEGARSWLRAIAQHVLHRWLRASGRQHARVFDGSGNADVLAEIPDGRWSDPSSEVERSEVVAMVRHCLTMLPGDRRDLLLAHYRDEMSIAELARLAGISPGNAAVRLQRSRDQLRGLLLEHGGPHLADIGVDLAAMDWRPTRLWCPVCGQSRLSMELDGRAGIFALSCPQCSEGPGTFLYNWRLAGDLAHLNPLGSVRSAAKALDRTMEVAVWTMPGIDKSRPCPICGAHLRSVPTIPQGCGASLDNVQLDMHCPYCGPLDASATFAGLAIFHRQGVAFWRQHERIVVRPPRPVVFDQRDAVQVDLTSQASESSMTFIFSPTGERLLEVTS